MTSERIERLSQVFAHHRTYPISKYTSGTPLRVFQALYPEDHYSVEIAAFLESHDYNPTQRGADLPWWGPKFFTDEPGCRVMVIAQDSYAEDAGSIVFYAALFPMICSEHAYRGFTARLRAPKTFGYGSWRAVRDRLVAWNIKLEFCYITDAAKVYKSDSWEYGDLDREGSVELLQREIAVCGPQLIILLGGDPLRLLRKGLDYGTVVEGGKPIVVGGISCVVSPFFIGNGRSQPRFQHRLDLASGLIGSLIRDKDAQDRGVQEVAEGANPHEH